MLLKLMFSVAVVVMPVGLMAAESTDENLKISGHLDMNYQFNFNNPRPVTAPTDAALAQPGANNQYRVFDMYHDNLMLSLVEINLSKKVGPTSVYASFGFGHTADVLSPRDEVSKNVLEAHLTYTPEKLPELSVTVGKMFTHMGLEVAPTKANWNYSRSVLFGYSIPLWHTGAAVRYDFKPDGALKGGLFVYNETVGLYGTDPGKTIGGQLSGIPLENLTLTYNVLTGTETSSDSVNHVRTVHEIIPTYVLNDSWEFNADLVYGELTNARANQSRNASWTAFSVGAKWKNGDMYISPRYENYADRTGSTIEIETPTKPALPQRIESATITAAWDLGGGLETRVEARLDKSSSDAFTTGEGETKDTQSSALVGLLYDF